MAATWSWRSSPTSAERLAVARILGAKGLAGGVRVEPLTDWPEHLDAGAEVFFDEEDHPRKIRRTEAGGRVPVLYLEGVESREAAEVLAGRYLEVAPAPLPADSYYWHQLEGLAVNDEAGAELGTLVEVFRAGGNEVYRVVGPDGERLVPALKRVVRSIDLAAGRMVVRLDPEDEETA